MSKFREYVVQQGSLLPLFLDQMVPEEHPARIIHEVVERLDIREIEKKMRDRQKKDSRRGRDAYHPRLLLGILFYGYCTGTFSSRKLADRVVNDVPMIWLAARQTPDFRTISDFRKDHLAAVNKLFVQVLELCQAMGMVQLGHVSFDGSHFKANASKHKAMSAGRLQEKIEALRRQVQEMLAEAERADSAEDAALGARRGDELPEELRRKQDRLKRLEAAQAELQRRVDAESGQPGTPIPDDKQINFTDGDSRIMAKKHTEVVQGYNAQIGVDHKEQVIVAATLTNDPADAPQLKHTLDAMDEQCGVRPEKASADNGFFSGDNIAELQERGIDAFLAPGREGKDVRNPYDKRKFVYDPEQDAYQCPEGHWLPLKSIHHLKDGHTEWVYEGTEACLTCPARALCTKAKTGRRTITRDDQEPLREAMRLKMQSQEAKDVYKRRKCIVEPVFGQIKEVMGFRRFLLRGMPKVHAEFLLVGLAHNLRRVTAKLRHSPQLWSTLRNWTPVRGAVALEGAQ